MRLFRRLRKLGQDENFFLAIKQVDGVVAKFLSILMVIVIAVAIIDLSFFLVEELRAQPLGALNKTAVISAFGLFLNVLIALEILENITAYLRKHVVQVELVIVTSLIAVARKIIIFDFSKQSGVDLLGLGTAVLALSISYWIVKRMNTKHSS